MYINLTITIYKLPWTLSPNIVRNMVKLIGPGASAIIDSNSGSVHILPADSYDGVMISLVNN